MNYFNCWNVAKYRLPKIMSCKSLQINQYFKKTYLCKEVPLCVKTIPNLQENKFQSHFKFPPSIMITQIRFCKDYPKLHRDIVHPNFDDYRKDKFKDLQHTTWNSGDEKHGYTYVVGFFGMVCGMYAAKSELTHFLMSMAAAADVLALATIEVNISNIAPGMCSSYKWRGKPLFVKHRTSTEISAEAGTPLSVLKDPETPDQRTIKPEWLVVIGICTHLGCVPVPNSGDYAGGFYCPCHGSHYDNVGRARKGPAPLNLEVPPHKFISDDIVLVG